MKLFLIVATFFLLGPLAGYTQYLDTIKPQPYKVPASKRFLTGSLAPADSLKVSRIKTIQDEFKTSMNELMKNTSLSAVQQRDMIDQLVSTRDEKLERLLTPSELKRAFPNRNSEKPVTGGRPKVIQTKQ